MLCPKCYGKVDKQAKRCVYCGFDMRLLEGASNQEAKRIRKTIYKDDILYMKGIPADVSKKKLLLFSIFLGLFGVHDFYVGKFWQGLYLCISTSITMTLAIILMLMSSIVQNTIQIIFEFMTIFQGIAVIIWITDIFKIGFERFKIPVYSESFSEDKTK